MNILLRTIPLTAALLIPFGANAAGTNFGETTMVGFGEEVNFARPHTSPGNTKGNGHDCFKPGKRKGHTECGSPD